MVENKNAPHSRASKFYKSKPAINMDPISQAKNVQVWIIIMPFSLMPACWEVICVMKLFSFRNFTGPLGQPENHSNEG
jgi:hypothetical protein